MNTRVFCQLLAISRYLPLHFSLVLSVLLAGCGGGSSGDNSQPDTTIVPQNSPTASGISLYDTSRIREIPVTPANIVANGSFDDTGEWNLCGSSLRSEPGRGQYLQLDSTPDCADAEDSFQLINSAAFHPITLSSVPEFLYISFLARSSQPIELFSSPVDVYLVSEASRDDVVRSFGAWVNNSEFTGIGTHWTPVKMKVSRSEIQDWIGDNVPNWLMFRTSVTAGYRMDIDDVRLSTSEIQLVQPQPMPIGITNSTDRLAFINYDSKIVASAGSNGSDYTPYEFISSDNLRLPPQWLGADRITVGRSRFYPSVTTDATVLPGEGTDVINYSLNTGTKDIIYQSTGSPGRFEFAGSFANSDALDVTVRNGRWDIDRNRGAFSICGQNRQWDFVSDDVCIVAIMDTEGNISNDQTSGYNPAWSTSGQIAYVYEDKTYIGRVNNNGQITSQVVTNGGTPRAAAWSSDGSRLAIMTDGAATVQVGDVTYTAQAVNILNVNSGEIIPLTLLDHGNAYSDLTWINNTNYLAYSVLLDNPITLEIWWLDATTGATGPIINTINAGAVSSRDNP